MSFSNKADILTQWMMFSARYWQPRRKLNRYLADIDEQAAEMMFRLVEQMAGKEGVTEQLKAENSMLWVGRMNEIQARAREIVNMEIIYA